MSRIASTLAVATLALVFVAGPAIGQFDDVVVKKHEASGNVVMLEGRGGNIAVCTGPKGVFMVDSQFAPLTAKIRAEIETLSKGPVSFLVNTHWHGDHVGGNANFQNEGTVVVAHNNVRKRMSAEHFNDLFDRQMPASDAAALPVVTFSEDVTFYWDGGAIEVFHVGPAHTDTDAMIYFRKENVLHMGDIFFNGAFPFIDVTSGGTAAGYVPAIDRALALTGDDTVIIPGHGAIAGRKDLLAYREFMQEITSAIQTVVEDGRTLEEVKAMDLLAKYPESWGAGFVQPDLFITTLYRSYQ
ncbi:MAG: MBL fold metallo-hydrolase [Gemmatimonadetes bacterium]|nr:MBL fold metallo-hydrolase [Gemmatimonadota bacterium]